MYYTTYSIFQFILVSIIILIEYMIGDQLTPIVHPARHIRFVHKEVLVIYNN